MREFNQDVDQLIGHLIESSGEFKDIYRTEKTVYLVRRAEKTDDYVTFEIEVPPMQEVPLVNRIVMHWDEYPSGDEQQATVLQRMKALAKSRDYPPDSVFETPWGRYLVRDLI